MKGLGWARLPIATVMQLGKRHNCIDRHKRGIDCGTEENSWLLSCPWCHLSRREQCPEIQNCEPRRRNISPFSLRAKGRDYVSSLMVKQLSPSVLGTFNATGYMKPEESSMVISSVEEVLLIVKVPWESFNLLKSLSSLSIPLIR